MEESADIGDRKSADNIDEEDMWGGMEATAAAECDCSGPPPEFILPPPPRPPILQPSDPMYCTEDPLPNIETCDVLPLIDASYRSSPSFQTSAVIVLCSVVLGLFVFIGIILVWKHKRKVQNFLPCKNSPQNNREGTTTTAIYEDLHDVMPRPTPTPHHHHHHHHHHHTPGGHIVAPSIEMIDVKNSIHYPSGYPISQHPPVFLCSSPGPDPYCSQDLYNPVYEELSDADSGSEPAPARHSEDEFAEDELSVGGGDRRDAPPLPPSTYRFRRPHEPLPPLPTAGASINRRHRSLDRRRNEFHEGMLLDALLQLYPRGVGTPPSPADSRRQIPSVAQRVRCPPYDGVNVVLGHLATFRPPQQSPLTSQQTQHQQTNIKPYSQDSAFGSDSGYSNHTCGTRGSSRGRRTADPRRLSQLSADLALT